MRLLKLTLSNSFRKSGRHQTLPRHAKIAIIVNHLFAKTRQLDPQPTTSQSEQAGLLTTTPERQKTTTTIAAIPNRPIIPTPDLQECELRSHSLRKECAIEPPSSKCCKNFAHHPIKLPRAPTLRTQTPAKLSLSSPKLLANAHRGSSPDACRIARLHGWCSFARSALRAGLRGRGFGVDGTVVSYRARMARSTFSHCSAAT